MKKHFFLNDENAEKQPQFEKNNMIFYKINNLEKLLYSTFPFNKFVELS